jgi:hypothetical protein
MMPCRIGHRGDDAVTDIGAYGLDGRFTPRLRCRRGSALLRLHAEKDAKESLRHVMLLAFDVRDVSLARDCRKAYLSRPRC